MRNLILILLLLSATGLSAQKYYKVDLSIDSHDEHTISIDHSGIELVNKLPGTDYFVKIEVETEVGKEADTKSTERLTKNACDPKLLDNVKKATTEKAVEEAIAAIEKLIEGEKDKDKKTCLEQALKEAAELTTEQTDFSFGLEKNQNIFIKIARKDTAGEEVKSWNITLRTPRTVNYITHFGFTFVPDGLRSSDRYFANETAPDIYTITQMNNNGSDFWKDVSLTVNYIIPICHLTPNQRVKFGWNGAFGLSGDAKFTVMTGATVLFDDFLSLNFDMGLHNRYKLKGEYHPAQELAENLSIDQLNEMGLRPAFMISLGFRLSKEQLQADIENKGSKN
jgi:hypothetical protein